MRIRSPPLKPTWMKARIGEHERDFLHNRPPLTCEASLDTLDGAYVQGLSPASQAC